MKFFISYSPFSELIAWLLLITLAATTISKLMATIDSPGESVKTFLIRRF
jgi:hypothetical protein